MKMKNKFNNLSKITLTMKLIINQTVNRMRDLRIQRKRKRRMSMLVTVIMMVNRDQKRGRFLTRIRESPQGLVLHSDHLHNSCINLMHMIFTRQTLQQEKRIE